MSAVRPPVDASLPEAADHAPYHRRLADLDAGFAALPPAPRELGTLEMIVRRPDLGTREVLDQGALDTRVGLVGDTWDQRPSRRSADGGPHPDMQLNVMNARVVDLLAGDRSRWPLAGDQLYVDLDLSADHLPPGTRIAIGGSVIEVTDQPHTGCAKFAARFGRDALRFVSTPPARAANLRGLNARVVTGGTITRGDEVRVLR